MHRALVIDGEACEFSDSFSELHTQVCASILAGSGLGVADARPSVELAERLRSLRHSPLDGDAHPLCCTRLVTRG